MGEMGGSFARGLLRHGHPVVPVLRDSDADDIAVATPDPVATLVTVGEADLDHTLATLPRRWRESAVLVQNELLPRNWEAHGYDRPTVAVVWFEKKPGRTEKVIIPTPVFGPCAEVVISSLGAIGIPTIEVTGADDLLHELVRKNMYILTANIGGLVTRSTVQDLWYNNRQLAETVFSEILAIQEWLTGTELDRKALLEGMVEAFDADPDHGSTGRSAPMRLARALRHADQAGLETPTLREIQNDLDLVTA